MRCALAQQRDRCPLRQMAAVLQIAYPQQRQIKAAAVKGDNQALVAQQVGHCRKHSRLFARVAHKELAHDKVRRHMAAPLRRFKRPHADHKGVDARPVAQSRRLGIDKRSPGKIIQFVQAEVGMPGGQCARGHCQQVAQRPAAAHRRQWVRFGHDIAGPERRDPLLARRQLLQRPAPHRPHHLRRQILLQRDIGRFGSCALRAQTLQPAQPVKRGTHVLIIAYSRRGGNSYATLASRLLFFGKNTRQAPVDHNAQSTNTG